MKNSFSSFSPAPNDQANIFFGSSQNKIQITLRAGRMNSLVLSIWQVESKSRWRPSSNNPRTFNISQGEMDTKAIYSINNHKRKKTRIECQKVKRIILFLIFWLTAHYYVGRISSSPCRCCDARVSFSLFFFFYILQRFDCDGFHCPLLLLLLAFSLSRISFCFNVPTPVIKRESYSFVKDVHPKRWMFKMNVLRLRLNEKKNKKKVFLLFCR